MGDCTRATGPKWVEAIQAWDLAREECVYDLEGVAQKLDLGSLGATSLVTDASFNYAYHPFEPQPNFFNPTFESQMAMVRQRLHKAHAAFMRRGSNPPIQVVWIVVDPKIKDKIPTENHFLKDVVDGLLEKMRYTRKGEPGKKLQFNVRFETSETPPAGVYATVFLSPEASLRETTPPASDLANENLGGTASVFLDHRVLNEELAVERILHALGHLWGLDHPQTPPPSPRRDTGELIPQYAHMQDSKERIFLPLPIMNDYRIETNFSIERVWSMTEHIYLQGALGEVDITPPPAVKKKEGK